MTSPHSCPRGRSSSWFLKKDNAIADLRRLMGATNPANAEEGTIRKKFANSIQENAIHGSDAEDTAAFEIGYWFAGYELI